MTVSSLILVLPPWCWHYRWTQPYKVNAWWRSPKASCMRGKNSFSWATHQTLPGTLLRELLTRQVVDLVAGICLSVLKLNKSNIISTLFSVYKLKMKISTEPYWMSKRTIREIQYWWKTKNSRPVISWCNIHNAGILASKITVNLR